MTDSRPDSESTPPKSRGLWSLMGASEPAAAPTDSEPAVAEAHQEKAEDSTSATSQSQKPRGLWGMMGQAPAAAAPVDAAVASPNPEAARTEPELAAPDSTNRVAPRGLFALMQRAEQVDAGIPDVPSADRQADATVVQEAEEDDSEVEDLPPTPRHVAPVLDLDELEPRRYRFAASQAGRQGWIGLTCGIAAVLTSALSLLPHFLAGIPATSLGFIAIVSGYLALTGAGRRDITGFTRGISLLGMLLGTAGVFLGPLLFAGIGRGLREATGPQATRLHLHQIGEGLEQFYTKHDGYPIGGTFGRNSAGVIHGQHGWMTFLLPFVGESALYQEVDQSVPYDDPANRKAMGQNVSVYFAAGGDRARIGDGFAVAHYAGLGGEINDAKGLAHVGIFERDVAVKREEITDGLSETLIVGEVAGGYPPWGDPENWRKIGRGLNKDINGFGSFSGQGATFLLADGSVKYFGNRTDPKLLEKMSTRDGAE